MSRRFLFGFMRKIILQYASLHLLYSLSSIVIINNNINNSNNNSNSNNNNISVVVTSLVPNYSYSSRPSAARRTTPYSVTTTNYYNSNNRLKSFLSVNSCRTVVTNMSHQMEDNDIEKNAVEKGLKLGFVGFGTIASSIAIGLMTQTRYPIYSMKISRRSESRSSALSNQYPEKVTVCDDVRDIVTDCDIVFLCVLPEQVNEVFEQYQLQLESKVDLISLVATTKLAELQRISNLPKEKIHKMICLPSVAQLQGTPLLVPNQNKHIQSIVSTLGGGQSGDCIACENEAIMESLMVTSCMMGPVYGLMKQNRDFLIQRGVPPQDASHFVGKQYFAMVADAERECKTNPNRFDHLIEEQTPGGLNEQSLHNLEKLGFLDSYQKAMDAILKRIQGTSDGSII